MMNRIAALVLAGGAARRMGGLDKPLLDLGGRSMLAHVFDRIGLPDIAISANGDPTRFAAFGAPVLDDGMFLGEGPLAGMLAGLDWAAARGAADLLTLPGDTPFVPRNLATALAPSPACAAGDGQVHHLVALWPVACRESLRALLSEPGRRDIRWFAASIGMRRVDFPVGKWDPFMNINTMEQLAAARAMLDRPGMEGWA